MNLAEAYFQNIAKLINPINLSLSKNHVEIIKYTSIFHKELQIDYSIQISLQLKNGAKNSLNFNLEMVDQDLKDIIKDLFNELVYGLTYSESLNSFSILLDYLQQLRQQLINKYNLSSKYHENLSIIDLTRYNYLMETLRAMDPPNQMLYSYPELYEKVQMKMDEQFSLHNLTKLASVIDLNRHTSSINRKHFSHEFFTEIGALLKKHFKNFYVPIPSVVFIAIIQQQIMEKMESTLYSIVISNKYLLSEDNNEYQPNQAMNSPQFDLEDFVSEFATIGKLDKAAQSRLASQLVSVNENSSYVSFQQIPSQIEAKIKQVGSRLTAEQIVYFRKIGQIITNTPERTYKIVIAQLRALHKQMQ